MQTDYPPLRFMAPPSPQRPWLRAVGTSDSGPDSGAEPLSDEHLIQGLLEGDRRLSGLLHDRLIGAVDHTLFRVLGRREHDHDDLVQSCFEQIVRSLTRGQFEHQCSLKTWATRISTHVALNALRSRIRERRVVGRPEEALDPESYRSGGPSPETHLDVDRVRMALSRMRLLTAEVLVLHEIHGNSLAEISELTGLSVSAAQSRLVRGRKELQERLSTRMAEGLK